ncbi:hypothetical protein PIROE2DRAFT_9494 [Piromyces sp. E2]|nr:hypothetical protein PIROE2DRAFT_9494 [Piromyces sp. E2]|eukprot:OUM63889.1 hypothetical protein PIROE2DRAFT_9494 [Piromyces sp. E2]
MDKIPKFLYPIGTTSAFLITLGFLLNLIKNDAVQANVQMSLFRLILICSTLKAKSSTKKGTFFDPRIMSHCWEYPEQGL